MSDAHVAANRLYGRGWNGLALRLRKRTLLYGTSEALTAQLDGHGRWMLTIDGRNGGRHTYYGSQLRDCVYELTRWIDEGEPD
jgi:hypothetical protein